MSVAILVPRREGFADRDLIWSILRRRWSTYLPDWPIVEGHHEIGPFNRSAAVNEAARLAGDWDVALVIDSDVLIDPDACRWAVEEARSTGNLVVPFQYRRNVSPSGTRRILDGYDGSWSPFVVRTYEDQHSSVIAFSRKLYDDVGGFDEAFQGWGLEDTAWAIACEAVTGAKLVRRWGAECWHLHHATSPGEKHGSPTHRANMARANRYRAALSLGDADAIRKLVAEGREIAEGRASASIPRILHRVVPEETPRVAEEWWKGFGKLHPGWRLLTHRDPLDPEEWPLTSPSWDRVQAGAQLADLVRLEALLRWGGFYVDQDVQPFRSLEPLTSAEVVAAWEDERVVPNAFLAARPDHPAIRECLDLALKRIRSQRPRASVWDVGPGVTTEILTKRKDVLLLPPASVYDVHYRDPDRDRKMTEKPSPWTFARHHYWGSWLPEERRRIPA